MSFLYTGNGIGHLMQPNFCLSCWGKRTIVFTDRGKSLCPSCKVITSISIEINLKNTWECCRRRWNRQFIPWKWTFLLMDFIWQLILAWFTTQLIWYVKLLVKMDLKVVFISLEWLDGDERESRRYSEANTAIGIGQIFSFRTFRIVREAAVEKWRRSTSKILST